MKYLCGVKETGDALAYKKTKVYDLIRRGELRVVRVDGRIRVPVSAIAEYVARLEADADNDGPKAA